MAETTSAVLTARTWPLLAFIGLACFAFSLVVFSATAPELSYFVTAAAAAVCGTFSMVLAACALVRRAHLKNRRMLLALDNMPQGLCMFNAKERLLFCNDRYRELYQLSAAISTPGTALADILAFRAANGTFLADPSEFRRKLIADMAEGKSTTIEVQRRTGGRF